MKLYGICVWKYLIETINENSQEQDGEEEPKRSKRARIEKSFGPDFFMYMLEGEPWTFKEVVNSTEGLMWKEAIKSEIESILHNHTWDLVDLQSGCKPLNSKWVFKRKMKVDGSIVGISNGPGWVGRPDQVRPAARFGPDL